MIVFDLACALGHRFEGWFGSSEDFSAQRRRRLLACPTCGSQRVERLPSATRINVGATPASAPAPAHPEKAEPKDRDPMAIAQILYARLVDEMLSRSEDVGAAFPEEARRIHYEEAPARSIRGQATREQHAELLDEGIPVLRIAVPDRSRMT